MNDNLAITPDELIELFNHLPDVVILVNEQGKIILSNSSIKNILGWEPREILGISVDNLLPPESRKNHASQYRGFFKNPSPRKFNERSDLYAWHKEGFALPVDIKLSSCTLNNQKYGVAVIRDATVQRNLQHQLETKNTELQQTNEAKNRFLGIAAHDLRNPIGLVGNFSQILLESNIGSLNETQKEFLSKTYNLSQYMLGLLEDLLDISSIESGTMELKKESFRFLELVNDLMFSNESFADTKNIKLNILCNIEKEFRIYADRRKLQQIFHNLIDNAIKYSPADSIVEITMRLENNVLTTIVRDNGVGIPKDDLNQLFKPFFRAHNKPTNKEKSTGLGLFIVKRIIDAHNGVISVESEDGVGSIFKVTIPVESVKPSSGLE